jgi:hypothetical protein
MSTAEGVFQTSAGFFAVMAGRLARRVLPDAHMKAVVWLFSLIMIAGCADLRGAPGRPCGTFGERCLVPVDSSLVEAIASAWTLELDPLFPTRGPMMIGAGGDSAWTVAVYQRLKEARPQFFAMPVDTAHAPHLSGVTVEMLGDTARVTTSVSQCLTRETTYNWTESGLAHKFIPYKGKWALLPGSLAHVADGKC